MEADNSSLSSSDSETTSVSPKVVDHLERSREHKIQATEHDKTVKLLNRVAESRTPLHPAIQDICDNWKCTLTESLPARLRPRTRLANGNPVSTKQQDRKRLDTKQWGKVYIKALAELSADTFHDKDFAHELLAKEVRNRQNQRSHPQFYAREALTSDLRNVIEEMRRRKRVGRYKAKKELRVAGGKTLADIGFGESGEGYDSGGDEAVEDGVEASDRARKRGSDASLNLSEEIALEAARLADRYARIRGTRT